MTIVEFIEKMLSEDAAIAEAASALGDEWVYRDERKYHGPASVSAVTDESDRFIGIADATREPPTGRHIARHDPARVLREVAAIRALVPDLGGCSWCDLYEKIEDRQMQVVASIWADHPDYQSGWAL